MKLLNLIAVCGAAMMAGCAVVPQATLPVELRGIALTPVSSTSVTVREPLLKSHEGQLELVGYVTKVYGSATTESTHLDVKFLGASGETLRQQIAQFSPRGLTTGRRAPNRQATYAVAIAELPAGTARIEVRAHDAVEHQL